MGAAEASSRRGAGSQGKRTGKPIVEDGEGGIEKRGIGGSKPGWVEGSGWASVLAGSAKSCGRAGRFVVRQAERRGDTDQQIATPNSELQPV
jgi:hypothetical protein